MLGDPEKRQEVRRARRELAACTSRRSSRARAVPGRQPVRPADGERLEHQHGRPRRLPHDDRRGDARDVRGRGSVLGFLPARSSAAAAAGAGGRAGAAGARPRDAEGPRHRARSRADARRGVSRRDAADRRSSRAATRAAWTCASRPASRTARACAPPAKANRERTAARLAICICASASGRTRVFERKGNDLHTKVAVPRHHGRARRRSAGADDHRLGPAEDSARRRRAARCSGSRATGCRPSASRDDRGDLYATVDVQLPRSLTKEQRDALRGAQAEARE